MYTEQPARGATPSEPLFSLQWYRSLPRPARRTFWGATAGWGLDGFDTLSYTFALSAIAASLGVSAGQAGLAATISLATAVVGGILAGVLADHIGRVRTLVFTIAAYSVCSFLSGLAQTYEQLLLARALLGLGFGGEWTVGALLVSEVASPAHRSRLQGAFQSAYTVGWGLAGLGYALVFLLAPAALAWRLLFWLGLLPALLVFWVRRNMPESPIYLQARAERAAHPPAGGAAALAKGSIVGIFRSDLRRTTVAGFLLAAGALSGRYVLSIWLPTYLQDTRGLDIADATFQQVAVIAASFVGYFVGGSLNDALGHRRTFGLAAIASALTTWLYLALPRGADLPLLLVGVLMGASVSALVSGLGAYLSELYPTQMRGAGQGFCYSVGRGLSGLLPAAIGFAASGDDLTSALGWSTLAYSLCLLAILALPETRGKRLDQTA